jgi:hypothetical protein
MGYMSLFHLREFGWDKYSQTLFPDEPQLHIWEATIPADDPAWSKPFRNPGQPEPIPPRNEPQLHIWEATIPADDPAWSKPFRNPGHPEPIPPRNEPQLQVYIPRSQLASAVAQAAQDMQLTIHHETRDTERGKYLHKFDILMLFAYNLNLLFRIKSYMW